MGVRRLNARRARRDRVDASTGIHTVPAAPVAARYHYAAVGSAPPPPCDGKSSIRFSWAAGAARSIALVASFDGFMHHRMQRIALGHRAGPATFEITLRIPPGSYTYKYLVDGVWRVDRSAPHPVEHSADGLLQHRLVVNQTSSLGQALDLAGDAPPPPRGVPVVRSASVSDLHVAAAETCYARDATSAHSLATALHGAASAPAPLQDRVDRPGSFASPGAHRKSLIPRFGAGWMRRFSSRQHSATHEFSDFQSKENTPSFANIPAAHGTPERKRRQLRASGRAPAVTVSGPTRVDEPVSSEAVHQDANEWRLMARELQDRLADTAGARELLGKAIKHREKHGLWCTLENAQTHVDLARSLSKADRFSDAEFHLRIALRIYRRIDAGPEHVGDLLHYIGVVVDRQKKRGDAESLYRQALDTYRAHRVDGNNVEIALKNLSLNLRKQGRDHEATVIVKNYYSSARPVVPLKQFA